MTKNKQRTLKKLPIFRTDEEAADFIDNTDLSEYDLGAMKFYRFELVQEKTPPIDLAKSSPKRDCAKS